MVDFDDLSFRVRELVHGSDTGVRCSKRRHAHSVCASLYLDGIPIIGELHPEDATDPTLLTT